MNPETIIAQLEQINSWRRGEESEPQPDPKHVGKVIDAAVASLRSLIASNTTLRDQRDATRAELKLRKEDLSRQLAVNTELKTDLTRMEEYLRNSGRNMDEAQEQIAGRDSKIVTLSADLARATAANAKLSHELYEHRVSTDQYAKELDALKADLTRVTAERTQEYNELREACAKRENALRAELEKVTAERDHWIALYKERNKTAAILEDTSIALRARVAEVEKEAMILRGTVEAVTTQRQQAEQRNADLVAALWPLAMVAKYCGQIKDSTGV